jgi:hypothetical protein
VRARPTAVRMEGKPDVGVRGRLGDGGTRGARPGHNGVVAREAARRRDPKGGAVGPGGRRAHSKGKSEAEESIALRFCNTVAHHGGIPNTPFISFYLLSTNLFLNSRLQIKTEGICERFQFLFQQSFISLNMKHVIFNFHFGC